MKTNKLPVLIILSLCMTLISFRASAIESGVEGTQTRANVTVNNASSWTTLSNSVVVIPAGQIWHCVATGSADGQNPGRSNTNMRYRFTLTIDNTSPATDGACERTVQFDDNDAISDTNFKAVSSTCTFKNIDPGTHTIRWLARKFDADKPNLTVLDNSHSVVCSDNLL
jgi:hypothetical protein